MPCQSYLHIIRFHFLLPVDKQFAICQYKSVHKFFPINKQTSTSFSSISLEEIWDFILTFNLPKHLDRHLFSSSFLRIFESFETLKHRVVSSAFSFFHGLLLYHLICHLSAMSILVSYFFVPFLA